MPTKRVQYYRYVDTSGNEYGCLYICSAVNSPFQKIVNIILNLYTEIL